VTDGPVTTARSPRDLALLCLRFGLGILFLRAGWAKVSSLAGIIGLWQRLHLPAPHVFGPVHAVVEFGGAILLLAGGLTRVTAFLLAVDMVGALLLVKIHTPATFIGVEWLALWMSLALLVTGAGGYSLDARFRRGRSPAGSR